MAAQLTRAGKRRARTLVDGLVIGWAWVIVVVVVVVSVRGFVWARTLVDGLLGGVVCACVWELKDTCTLNLQYYCHFMYTRIYTPIFIPIPQIPPPPPTHTAQTHTKQRQKRHQHSPEGLSDWGEGQDDVQIAPNALDKEGEEGGGRIGDALLGWVERERESVCVCVVWVCECERGCAWVGVGYSVVRACESFVCLFVCFFAGLGAPRPARINTHPSTTHTYTQRHTHPPVPWPRCARPPAALRARLWGRGRGPSRRRQGRSRARESGRR
jgi:hypothetical protein